MHPEFRFGGNQDRLSPQKCNVLTSKEAGIGGKMKESVGSKVSTSLIEYFQLPQRLSLDRFPSL